MVTGGDNSVLCSSWNPSHIESTVLIATMETLALLSFFGSFFVALTYGIFRPQLRHVMPVWLSVSTLCLSVFVLMSPLSGFQTVLAANVPCLIQALGIQFFSNATNFWSLAIFLHMHGVIVEQSPRLVAFFSSWWMHLLVWGLSAVLTAIPGGLGLIGPSGPWCWLRCSKYDMWGFIFYFGEMFVVVVIQVFLWIRMFRALRALQHQQDSLVLRSGVSTMLHRCSWFVWLNFVLFIFMAAYRLLQIIVPFLFVYILELLDSLAISSMGLLLSFCVFGLTKENYHLWMHFKPSCFNASAARPYEVLDVSKTPLGEAVNEFTSGTDEESLNAASSSSRGRPEPYPIPKPLRNLRNDRSYAASPGSNSETSDSEGTYRYGTSYGTMTGVNFKEVEFASG